jgi:hypothetical protein
MVGRRDRLPLSHGRERGAGGEACLHALADLVAGLLDGGGQPLQADDVRIEDDACLLGGEVDARLLDTVDLAERPLDPPDARGAGHPLDRQDNLRRPACPINRSHIWHGRSSCHHGSRNGLHGELADAVAGLLDGRDEIADRRNAGIVDDAGLLGGEVDGGILDTGDLAEPLLDAPDTRRAGHAGDRERHLDRIRSRVG